MLVYLKRVNDVKRSNIPKYLQKGVIRNYHVIINGKKFYDQLIDYDIGN